MSIVAELWCRECVPGLDTGLSLARDALSKTSGTYVTGLCSRDKVMSKQVQCILLHSYIRQ